MNRQNSADNHHCHYDGGETMSEAFSFNCCGEEMRCLGLVDVLAREVDSVRRWICPVCGHGVDLVHFDFDEMELQNELELYGEAASPLHTQQVKGGDESMENQDDNTAVLCPTKAGNGFKLVVNGVWYYTAKRNVWGTLRKGQSCVFRTIDDSKGAGRSGDMRKPLPQRATTRDLDYSDPEFVMAAAPAQ